MSLCLVMLANTAFLDLTPDTSTHRTLTTALEGAPMTFGALRTLTTEEDERLQRGRSATAYGLVAGDLDSRPPRAPLEAMVELSSESRLSCLHWGEPSLARAPPPEA